MTRPKADGHLWQIDIVRLLAFGAVIAVHSIAFTQQPSNQVAAGALMLLQFGREIFFALTGFVLVYAARTRTTEVWSFWRRRLPLIVLPYLVWTLIYYLSSTAGAFSWSQLGADILSGGAAYHLYFLLVTMQLYVVFPALLVFVRRTRDHAWPILAIVGAVNLSWLAAVQYVPSPLGTAGFFWNHAYELLPTYGIYVLAGCYAALHLAQLQSVLDRHRRRLTAGAATLAGLGMIAYVAQLGSRAPRDAAAVLQPAMLLISASAAILLYLAGSQWAQGPRRRGSTVRVASDISFGVYLAHPLILTVLLDNGLGRLPSPLATLLGFVGPLAGAAALTIAARRTRLSRLLAGRHRRARPAGRRRLSARTAASPGGADDVLVAESVPAHSTAPTRPGRARPVVTAAALPNARPMLMAQP